RDDEPAQDEEDIDTEEALVQQPIHPGRGPVSIGQPGGQIQMVEHHCEGGDSAKAVDGLETHGDLAGRRNYLRLHQDRGHERSPCRRFGYVRSMNGTAASTRLRATVRFPASVRWASS